MTVAPTTLYETLNLIEQCKECKDYDTLYELAKDMNDRKLLEYLCKKKYIPACLLLYRQRGHFEDRLRYLIIASRNGSIEAKQLLIKNHRSDMRSETLKELVRECDDGFCWYLYGRACSKIYPNP